MRQVFDDASIHLKLLISPAASVVALALLCGSALRGYNEETVLNTTVAEATQDRLKYASDAKVLAAGLQGYMFRFTTFGLMGLPRANLEEIGAEITRRDLALEAALAHVAWGAEHPAERALLLDAWQIYRRQSSHAVSNLLNNLGWGATTARNAGVALDAVIEQAGIQEDEAQARVDAAELADATLTNGQRAIMLFAVGLGSPLVILLSLFVAHRIAAPIRNLTFVMTRLADRHYDEPIPAISQRDEVGSMARAVAVFKDGMLRADILTAQQQATQAFLDTVLEHVPATIFVKDAADLTYLHINRAAEAFLGIARQTLLGNDGHAAMPALSQGMTRDRDLEALSAGEKLVDEGVVIETSGNGRRVATVTRLAIAGAEGGPKYLLTMIEDVTDRRRAEQRIAYMAHFDALTDIPNRTLFAERLADAVADAQREASCVAVLGLDLDRFKEVNDTLGHAAGDELLRAVTVRLALCLRAGDTLARLGGDEFAIIQQDVRRISDAEALASRLIEKSREVFLIAGQQVFIGLSVGIAFSAPGSQAAELVKQADMALYEAKASGRGRFCCFARDMDVRWQQRRQMESDLRAAVGTPQLALHYQPQVDLTSFAILGAEALMRWNRPGHGNVPPNLFIPLAEENGLIGPLGAWLLQVACEAALQWPAHMLVAVNVSPIQLRMPGFLDSVKRALDSTGLAPERLELEVTEGVLLNDTEETLAILAELRVVGVRLAMDDFGTGYASLAYLQKFRFDKIKIDRSFINGIATDPNAEAIVRAMIGLSDLLGIRTNAEGVETDDQIALLRGYGCQEAQGFRFWKPMPESAMRELVAASQQPVVLAIAAS